MVSEREELRGIVLWVVAMIYSSVGSFSRIDKSVQGVSQPPFGCASLFTEIVIDTLVI